jgi:hypothetical protein
MEEFCLIITILPTSFAVLLLVFTEISITALVLMREKQLTSVSGHVNVSPKGGVARQEFGVPNARSFWYMDM